MSKVNEHTDEELLKTIYVKLKAMGFLMLKVNSIWKITVVNKGLTTTET